MTKARIVVECLLPDEAEPADAAALGQAIAFFALADRPGVYDEDGLPRPVGMVVETGLVDG